MVLGVPEPGGLPGVGVGDGAAGAGGPHGPLPEDARMTWSQIGAALRARAVPLSALALLGWALVAWRVGARADVVAPALLLGLLGPALTVVDVAHQRLPDRLVLPGAALVTVAGAVGALVRGDASALWRSLAAGGVLLAGFAVLALLAPGGGFGLGDVKCALLVGPVLGWAGWPAVAHGVLAAFLAAGVVAAVLLAAGIRGRALPFGPFLFAGTALALALNGPPTP
ncbi:prepilin peptidase [Allostreptomyces psammosilenae]|uniref:Leader peptidase (Prepilin peptidase)/N-methyltransferase n=1 Tax=Allostreptomyces psammosilenae TaxID=1892865 RepID=A0A852ZPQ9_9ACTN|nr:A24 family peptidase [Allostreptomyces psammosilenae]NYI03240.1 leader peptidase (prepilin peptidase)/N-methyltransferase [Allostreptomyces psammosilenae]